MGGHIALGAWLRRWGDGWVGSGVGEGGGVRGAARRPRCRSAGRVRLGRCAAGWGCGALHLPGSGRAEGGAGVGGRAVESEGLGTVGN